MKQSGKRSRLFKQILLSHVLIFAIPFIVLSSVVYYNAVVRFKSETESSSLYKLTQVMNTFDLIARGLDNTASRISIDTRLTPFMVKSGIYKEIEAIEELGKYKANNTIVDDLALYFHGDERLYSSNGMNSLDTFTKQVYRFTDLDGARLGAQLNETRFPAIRRAQAQLSGSENAQNVLTYMFPIPRNSQSPYATVLFLIRESMLTDLVGPILGDFNGSVYVSDTEGRIIASRSREIKLTDAEAAKLSEAYVGEGVHDVSYDNERYSLMKVKSEVSGWSYVVVMPTSQFLGRVLEMRTFIVLICLAVVAFGIATAVLLSTRQYRPIRHIAEHVRPLAGRLQGSGERRGNELDLIRDTVRATKDLMEQIDEQRPIVREQFFVKLLRGALRDASEVDTFIERENLAISGKTCFVAVVSMEGNDYVSTQNREELLCLLSEVELPQAVGYGVEMIQDNAIVILVAFTGGEEATRELQEHIAREIARQFEACCGIKPAIGVGTPVSGPLEANRSYIEASAAIEHNMRAHRGDIIFFDELSQWQESNDWYSVEEQIRLVQSMKQGNKEAAGAALDSLMNDLRDKQVSLFYLRCMCFDLINTFLRTMNELQVNIQPEHRQGLTEFTTLEQLGAGMYSLIEDICNHVNANKENKNSELGDRIRSYVQANFKDYDLNLEKISDHFQMSLSYFSRFMKEQTGYTFTDYVTHLRMEEVKRLLKETDIPIKDIVASVGYADVPNFMRKFKKSEGLTPGQFRKLYS
ncbi:helix-turn-helix domain-containing protein [Paenibacillus sp. GYB004]|uniref:helix-turn-helix domain-containing protein n=1 Tax=Paenibacillus sp. GYB004 TaxID=2994393 RepID=UPI002F960EE2